MTDFPASTRWLQTPNGAIAVKADGSVWRVQGSQHDRLCSENEWLAASAGQECAEVSDG
jgi:hypothetical protein